MQQQAKPVPAWPDMAIDRRAVEQARQELGPNATASAVCLRAQQIKERL